MDQARGCPPHHPNCLEAGGEKSLHPSHESQKGTRGRVDRQTQGGPKSCPPKTALVLILVLPLTIPASGERPPVKRDENIWVYLARNVLNASDFCLSGGISVEQTFTAGLIGVGAPIATIKNYTHFRHFRKEITYWDLYAVGPSVQQKDKDMFSLEVAAVAPSGECLYFTGCSRYCLSLFHNYNMRCSNNSSISYGSGHTRLPAGWFLICGLTVYTYIPANSTGGPCSLGRLTVPMPQQHPITRDEQYLSLTLPAACSDNLHGWSPAEYVSFTVFVTSVMVTPPQVEKGRLACSIVKALNTTGGAVSALNLELGQAGEADLKHRAARDYIRLRHNRGCDHFKGLCCFNLSDNSQLTEHDTQQVNETISTTKQCEGFCGVELFVIIFLPLLFAVCCCFLCFFHFRSCMCRGSDRNLSRLRGSAKDPLGDVRLQEGPGWAEGALLPAPSA